MIIIDLVSWHSNWPLQEVDVLFLRIGSLSQVKTKHKIVEWIEPGQKGRLRPYEANVTVHLWGCDLLQQWNIQFSNS